MKSKHVKLLSIFGGISFLALIAWTSAIMDNGTPDEFSTKEWPKTKHMAQQVTTNYFKDEKNMDIVIKDTSFSGEYATPEIYIEGHIAGDENQQIFATVNSADGYKVTVTP